MSIHTWFNTFTYKAGKHFGLLTACFFTSSWCLFAQPHLQFDHLEVPWPVLSMAQDQQGFIWFGSENALYRYDGYQFKEYAVNPSDPLALQTGRITPQIKMDRKGYLWIISYFNGIYRYDPVTEIFKHYSIHSDTAALPGNDVRMIYEDSQERLWISIFGHGLYLFSDENQRFEKFEYHAVPKNVFPENIYTMFEFAPGEFWLYNQFNQGHQKLALNTDDRTISINPDNFPEYCYRDHNGNVWGAGHTRPLVKYDEQTGKFILFETIFGNTTDEPLDSTRLAWSIVVDKQNNLFAPTRDTKIGLFALNTENGKAKIYSHNFGEPTSIKDGIISEVMSDRSGILWANYWPSSGSLNTVEIFNPHKPFRHINNYLPKITSSTDLVVSNIHVDSASNLWIGTLNQGLIRYNLNSEKVTQYFNDERSKEGWHFKWGIFSIFQDKYGILWLGSYSNGLYKLDPKSGKWKNYRKEFEEHGLPWHILISIHEDSRGFLWIGTSYALLRLKLDQGVGYDREFSSYEIFEVNDSLDRSISNRHINQIYEDKSSNVWIATGKGLCRFVPGTNDFDRYLNNLPIHSITSYNLGNLLVGTVSSLYKSRLLSNNTFQFERVELASEYMEKNIGGAFEDLNEDLWLILNNKIVKHSPETNSYRAYDQYDIGEIGDLQIHGGRPYVAIADNGTFYIGGAKGIISFHPDSLSMNPFVPPVVFTGLHIDNRPFGIRDSLEGKPVLSKSIAYAEKITLPHGRNFTLQFSALNFASAVKNQYSYKLEGFDKDWSPPGTTRAATFTNLWEGDYVFRVKGSNNDGIWNEEGASINITILPPWYRSKLAYGFYGGLVILALVWARKVIVQQEREKARRHIEHQELEQAREMDRLKSQFFANISHEFRTPLTLILGPLKQMYEGTFKGDTHAVIGVMIRNSKRLLHLINQLLDFSKLESGKVRLQTSIGDLVEFVRTMFATFESVAQSRKIRYVFQSDISSLPTYYDRDKLEKVITNLLSNAFKFTDNQGSIELTMTRNVEDPEVDKGEGVVEIRVTDNGKGIEADKLPRIFDRFYQADQSATRQQEGTGIGLALAKELVELHYGNIRVTSKKSEGTAFIIHLPLGHSHLDDTEVVIRKGYQPIDTTALETLPEIATIPFEPETNEDKPLVLIVDDNEDMRLYLKEILSGHYLLAAAPNGMDGWEYAREHVPDLVLSDVMMPEMDGHELCQKLKTDEHTSHIPVILLTARAGEKAKVEGLETGADDYVTKPFSPEELRARIHNLIELRQKLRERYSSSLSLEPKDIAITSADERFLQRALEIMEIHRSDSDFSAEAFVREIGMSRTQLHRKLKALTDQSTGDFIRSYRLKYARQLIEKDFGNMAQVAYECGFNNPSYFAECFKKQFGLLPSDYAKTKS